jgi:hypothetical protein
MYTPTYLEKIKSHGDVNSHGIVNEHEPETHELVLGTTRVKILFGPLLLSTLTSLRVNNLWFIIVRILQGGVDRHHSKKNSEHTHCKKLLAVKVAGWLAVKNGVL